jgi:hypothetical protein
VADDRSPTELSEGSYGREQIAKRGPAAEIGAGVRFDVTTGGYKSDRSAWMPVTRRRTGGSGSSVSRSESAPV